MTEGKGGNAPWEEVATKAASNAFTAETAVKIRLSNKEARAYGSEAFVTKGQWQHFLAAGSKTKKDEEKAAKDDKAGTDKETKPEVPPKKPAAAYDWAGDALPPGTTPGAFPNLKFDKIVKDHLAEHQKQVQKDNADKAEYNAGHGVTTTAAPAVAAAAAPAAPATPAAAAPVEKSKATSQAALRPSNAAAAAGAAGAGGIKVNMKVNTIRAEWEK